MSKFLSSVTAIGICDRCRVKLPLSSLRPDGNSKGLRVCEKCNDTMDPWRLAPRQTEDIALRFARPDTKLDT